MEAKDVVQIRKKLKLSQEAFADLIGVSKNTVYNWENGSKIPDSRAKMLKSLIYTESQTNEDFNFEENLLKKHAGLDVESKNTDLIYNENLRLKEENNNFNKLVEFQHKQIAFFEKQIVFYENNCTCSKKQNTA